MTWANFYLVCFLVGFMLSALSFLLGNLHLHVHVPDGGDAGFDGFHGDVGDAGGHAGVGHGGDVGGHGGDVGHGSTDAAGHGGDAAQAGHGVGGAHVTVGHGHVSPINFGTFSAFLAWFGGSGYLFTRWSPFWSVFGLGVAIVFGLIGAAIVFGFVSQLASRDENLDPVDYEMMGVLAHVSSGIRAGGTGEIIYSQEGTRRTAGARSEDGTAVPRGTEVVVTRYEKGIAYVERWDQLAGDVTREEPPETGDGGSEGNR